MAADEGRFQHRGAESIDPRLRQPAAQASALARPELLVSLAGKLKVPGQGGAQAGKYGEEGRLACPVAANDG